MIPNSVKNYSNLVTSRQAICLGFLAQAKIKSDKANPYVKEAKELWALLQKAQNVKDVVQTVPLKKLATAMGFSDKAQNRIPKNDLRTLVHEVIVNVTNKSGDQFHEEILYRFLLTRGDTLGGAMRNLTGSGAQIKFTSAVVTALNIHKKNPKIEVSPKSEEKIKSIIWLDRILVFDRKPKLIDKNIDVILLKHWKDRTVDQLLEAPSAYIACGELKGGIDPAGADEHWKTARSALARIRQQFKANCPSLFFAAYAIEEAMAKEIFRMLETEEL